MKRALSLVAALTLAMGLTACANTTMEPDMTPGYDGYGARSYSNYGYNSTNGNRQNPYDSNVSTTDSGRVNGTNRNEIKPDKNPRTNSNAMGSGMKG